LELHNGRTEAPSSERRRREDRGAEGVEWGRLGCGDVCPRPQTHLCYRYLTKLAAFQRLSNTRYFFPSLIMPWITKYDRKELKMEVTTMTYSSFQRSNCKYAKSWTARFPIFDGTLFRLDCTFWLDCTLTLFCGLRCVF